MNQSTAAATSSLAVNTGNCVVSGNLNFVGTNNTATFICKVAVTTGSFSLGGNVNWMNNTAVATELISVTTGTLTFNSPLVMTSGSGTLSVTGAGTINFNGASPSFSFGGTIAPVFNTAANCNLNFQHGFTNNSNALVMNANSNSIFTGNGGLTPNAPITFGNIQFAGTDSIYAGASLLTVAGTFTMASGSSLYALQSFTVNGNWTNNGGTLTGINDTVTLNGGAQTVGGTSSTTFPSLQIGDPAGGAAITVTMNNSNSCTNLMLSYK